MKAGIAAIEYVLPDSIVTNKDLAKDYPEWSVEKIEEKTGIIGRHVTRKGETGSDLAVAAVERLFASGKTSPESIDFILYCTQSPDHFLPTTACLVQERTGIPTTAGALDFNLGCSGYVYGLGLAKGLIETGQAKNILLITAETYSKYINPRDRSVRTLFGDAAAVTLVTSMDSESDLIGPLVYGTDGSGGKNLIVPAGAMRRPHDPGTAVEEADLSGNIRSADNLFMNGSEIFAFTLLSIPDAVRKAYETSGLEEKDIDLFVFHQANKFMLENLRKKMRIPEGKFVLAFREIGNTVSSTIPIALKEYEKKGELKPGMTLMLVGFGVGYSWGTCIVRWRSLY
jgi:3-oxoacyl-[acyl-carrier-protein] synthase-3